MAGIQSNGSQKGKVLVCSLLWFQMSLKLCQGAGPSSIPKNLGVRERGRGQRERDLPVSASRVLKIKGMCHRSLAIPIF